MNNRPLEGLRVLEFGAHNEEVYNGMLGISGEELARLSDAGAI